MGGADAEDEVVEEPWGQVEKRKISLVGAADVVLACRVMMA